MPQGNTPSERLATERSLRTTKETAWEKGLRLAKEVRKRLNVLGSEVGKFGSALHFVQLF
jgi:predicted DNA-binding protein